MKAMVLAAGLGTRLRPLTDHKPKALVEIAGRTLLEITLLRLQSAGINDVIINVHHFADMVVDYLKANSNFGMHLEISREEILLDTGGGLKKASYFFLTDHRDEPFVLHNVDVISTIDLSKMAQFHTNHNALATLAVQDRTTSRYLLFDANARLCGRRLEQENKTELVRSSHNLQKLAFSGVHVISTRFLQMMTEEGAFSIIAPYLRLAAAGEAILGFRADDYNWRDVGNRNNLQEAAREAEQKMSR